MAASRPSLAEYFLSFGSRIEAELYFPVSELVVLF